MWLTAAILASLLSLSSPSLAHCVSELSRGFLGNWQKASSRGTAGTPGIPSFALCRGYRSWPSPLANDAEITRSTSSTDGSSYHFAKVPAEVPAGGRVQCHVQHTSEVGSTSSARSLPRRKHWWSFASPAAHSQGLPKCPHPNHSLPSPPSLSPGRLSHTQSPLISEPKYESNSLLKGTCKRLSFRNSTFVGFFLLLCVCLVLRQVKSPPQKFIVRVFLYPEAEVYIFHIIFLEIAETVAWENCVCFQEKKRGKLSWFWFEVIYAFFKHTCQSLTFFLFNFF